MMRPKVRTVRTLEEKGDEHDEEAQVGAGAARRGGMKRGTRRLKLGGIP